MNNFLFVIKNRKQTIFTFVLLCFIFSGILTITQTFMYKTESKVLVYQDNIDPYAMSKSGQYLSSLLTSVIVTNSFYEEVVNAGYNIDVFYFSSNESERLVIWKNTVLPMIVDDSGVFRVDVYHSDKYQSKQIAQAVNYILKTKHNLYHGAGDNVTVKIIDTPITSNFPVRPRFVLNLFAGIACGLILGFFYIYLFPESKYEIKLISAKKKTKTISPVAGEELEEEKQDIENTKQIKKDIQKVLNDQIALSEKESAISATDSHKTVLQTEKQHPKVQNRNQGTIEMEDIEETGSMNNVIGFSNLGR